MEGLISTVTELLVLRKVDIEMWNLLKKKNLSIPEILERNRPPAESEEVTGALVQRESTFTELIRSALDRALAEGKSVEGILETDFGSLNSSAGETQDCLRPLEVLQYSRKMLARDRMEHVRSCSWCTTLIASAVPVKDEFATVLKRAKVETMLGSPMAASAGHSFEWSAGAAQAHLLQEKLFRG